MEYSNRNFGSLLDANIRFAFRLLCAVHLSMDNWIKSYALCALLQNFVVALCVLSKRLLCWWYVSCWNIVFPTPNTSVCRLTRRVLKFTPTKYRSTHSVSWMWLPLVRHIHARLEYHRRSENRPKNIFWTIVWSRSTWIWIDMKTFRQMSTYSMPVRAYHCRAFSKPNSRIKPNSRRSCMLSLMRWWRWWRGLCFEDVVSSTYSI